MQSKDQHCEIWKDEKHDLVTHEDAEDVHTDVLSSEESLPLSLVSKACLDNFMEKDCSGSLVVLLAVHRPARS